MRVLIPNPLRSYTAEAAVVAARGRTLDELATDLDRQYPGLRFRIVDEQGSIRPHINVYVAGLRASLTTAVPPDAVVHVIPAVSGG